MSPLAITSHVRSTLEQSTSTPEQASAGRAAQRSDAAKLVCSCFSAERRHSSRPAALFQVLKLKKSAAYVADLTGTHN